jgi:hypothetical protein
MFILGNLHYIYFKKKPIVSYWVASRYQNFELQEILPMGIGDF